MLHFAENMQITHLDYSELSLLEDCIFQNSYHGRQRRYYTLMHIKFHYHVELLNLLKIVTIH